LLETIFIFARLKKYFENKEWIVAVEIQPSLIKTIKDEKRNTSQGIQNGSI
jgi:hypothetical protein